jgi:hypothetical protein
LTVGISLILRHDGFSQYTVQRFVAQPTAVCGGSQSSKWVKCSFVNSMNELFKNITLDVLPTRGAYNASCEEHAAS